MTATPAPLPRIYFLATFWGERYRRILCRYALPSLISGGNLLALEEPRNARFVFATTAEDWRSLQVEPNFQLLISHIAAIFIEIAPKPVAEHKYVRMSRGHAALTEKCFTDGAIGFIVYPDAIYPDGLVAEAQRLMRLGKQAIAYPGTRFEMEGIDSELSERGMLQPGRGFGLPRREAVAIALRHMHPEAKAANWNAPNFGRLHPAHGRRHFLTCCFWNVPGERGVITITHNWNPLAIDYTKLSRHSTATLDGRALDGNYLFDNFADDGLHTRVHIVDDSDSVFVIGLTPRDEMVPPLDRLWWRDWRSLREWSRGYILNRTVFDSAIDPLRRQTYRIQVRWHADELTPQWRVRAQEVDELIRRYVMHDLRSAREYACVSRWERCWRRVLPLLMSVT